jgi:D-alanyl-D-alanine carboxypeptidase
MLETYEGVDGIKTGYINASGFNIVTSASRGGQRLIGAVFGGSSWTERDAHMAALLDRGFDQLGVAARAEARGPAILRSASAAPVPQAARAAPRAAPRQAAIRPAAARPAPRRSAARTQPARQVQARAAAPRPAPRPTAARAAAPTRTATAAPPSRSALGTPARGGEPSLAPPVPRGAGTVRTAELR